MSLKLIKLTKAYEHELGEMIDEWKRDQELNHTNRSPGAIFKNDPQDFDYYLERLELKEAADGKVPDSVFFLLDTDRGRLLGAVDIRHYLNDQLLKEGGHIGDGIRPSERRKGYATEMIRLALIECGKLGIDRVLMTCDKDNIGSAKSIINNGGILENEFVNSDGAIEQRYWIDIRDRQIPVCRDGEKTHLQGTTEENKMIVYHYSQTLKEGDRLEPGHVDVTDLCEPFIKALERSRDCFYGMLLNGRYMYAVLDRSGLRLWADYAKWATEGLFEFVRRKEFPNSVSRLRCCYFCTGLEDAVEAFEEGYGEEDEEEREKVRLFEVEVPEGSLETRDISLYDAAYDALNDRQDTDAAIELARKYFSGERGDEPIWEYLSAGDAVAVKDVSHFLRDRK